MPGVVSSPFPPCRPALPALCVRAVLSGCPLSSLAGTPFHAVCAFCGLGLVALLVFPACPLCVCALALPRRPRPPPVPWLVWRAHLVRSRCWALVVRFQAFRAPPRVLPRSLAPFELFGGGGGGPVPFPSYLAGGCVLPVGWVYASGAFERRGLGWGGGAACAPFPPTVRPGGPVGRGVALPGSVPLPSLGRQQSGCPWRRSGHGGCGPHTAPVRARLLAPGAVPVAPWCVGAGSLVHGGSCGSRRLGRGGGPCSGLPPGRRGPARGRGDHPLCLGGGGGRQPCGLRAGEGGLGDRRGGSHRGSPPPPSGGGGLRPSAQSPFCRRRIPPRCTRSVGVLGQPQAPGQACRRRASLAGGGGGAAREPPPPEGWPGGRGVVLPRPVPLPSLCGQHCGRHWRRSGSVGRGPHTAPVRCCVPPPSVARASFLRAGAGLPACCDPRGSRRWGARGRAVCGSSCVPPRASRSLLGEGGRPLGLVGGGGLARPLPARRGGEFGGEGRGCPAAVPHPPALGGWPVAPVPVPLSLRRTPPGLPGGRGRRARPGRPPMGQCEV